MGPGKIVFLVNGGAGSAMDIRAREFAKRLGGEMEIRIANRSADKAKSIAGFLGLLRRTRPDLCYVFDLAYSGVLAAGIYRKQTACPVIVDTGDAITDLARLTGSRGRVGIWLTGQLENMAYRISRRMVVRSHPHQEVLAARGIASEVIPDGVDTKQFSPREDPALRRELGVEGWTTIGLLGSIVWNERWRMCYGWDLVETLRLLRHHRVKGIVIGDGSGVAHLRAMAARYGIEDRLLLLGRRPYEELPRLLSAFDICLSTQTDDAAGRVRTTGKLPLYLACGRFVLASRVGEAALVLPPEMLVPYEGTKDVSYPERLSERIAALIADSGRKPLTSDLPAALARKHFDYDVLAERLRRTLVEARTRAN